MKKDGGLSVNEEILALEVRLVGDDGLQHGVVSISEALRVATDKNLDLVEVAPDARPPVCKILDYGRFKYDQKAKQKEAKKKAVVQKLKEIQISLKIGVGDLHTKINHAIKFLREHHKCKISVHFKGREMAYKQHGRYLLENVITLFDPYVIVETPPKLEGRRMAIIIAPKPARLGVQVEKMPLLEMSRIKALAKEGLTSSAEERLRIKKLEEESIKEADEKLALDADPASAAAAVEQTAPTADDVEATSV